MAQVDGNLRNRRSQVGIQSGALNIWLSDCDRRQPPRFERPEKGSQTDSHFESEAKESMAQVNGNLRNRRSLVRIQSGASKTWLNDCDWRQPARFERPEKGSQTDSHFRSGAEWPIDFQERRRQDRQEEDQGQEVGRQCGAKWATPGQHATHNQPQTNQPAGPLKPHSPRNSRTSHNQPQLPTPTHNP
jgi:hypothetical protein